jgi:glycolate oxidase FAD binding subunit
METFEQAQGHLTQRLRDALNHATPLRIRGGGSKDFYTAAHTGELLDTTPLSGVLSYEPSELVVTVGAGTPLATLEAVLAEQGQYLPFEPPHYRWSGPERHATVGGMVATGLSGPARASLGSVRDYVLGLQMLNGRAELLTFGGQVMKNVAGYDVSRLMAGALGTLGVITQVSLKVLPVAPAEATLVFEADQTRALEQLHRWGAQPLPLNASCWVHDATDPQRSGRDLLFVRLRGAVAAVEAACTRMVADLSGQRMDAAEVALDWQRCRDQQLPFFTEPAHGDCALWRLSVAQTAAAMDLPWAQLIEWHGALRWLWAPLDAGPTLQAAARAAGGTASVFFVPEGLRTAALVLQRLGAQGEAQAAIERRLKVTFDPQGIFNPALTPHANDARA